MERSPERMIPSVAASGSDTITVHVEAVSDIDRTIDTILTAGAEPSVAIRPRTPPSALRTVVDRLNRILVMTVEPGFGGQDFLPETLAKDR